MLHSTHPKGYRLLNEITGRVFIQRDVVFNEADFGKFEVDTIRSEDTVVIEATSEEPDEVSQPEACQRPVQQIRPPVRYGVDEYVDTASCTLKDQAHHAVYNVSQILEPMNMEEAMASDQAAEWKQAADSE